MCCSIMTCVIVIYYALIFFFVIYVDRKKFCLIYFHKTKLLSFTNRLYPNGSNATITAVDRQVPKNTPMYDPVLVEQALGPGILAKY